MLRRLMRNFLGSMVPLQLSFNGITLAVPRIDVSKFYTHFINIQAIKPQRKPNPADLHIRPHWRAPRNPVVLCHGLFGYDTLGPAKIPFLQLDYWGEIRKSLHDLGCEVYTAKVPPTSSVKCRAEALHKYLEKHFGSTYKSVNLIAHSMGGLDARYLISHLNPTCYEIKTLTTIATPHQGSSFMDFCRDNLGVGRNAEECIVLEKQRHLLGTTRKGILSPIDYPAYFNLTRDYCSKFNALTPNNPRVSYYSYAAVKDVPIYDPLYLSWLIVKKNEGVNDGLVSLKSASYGKLLGIAECDHWEITAGVRNSTFDSIEFFMQIATNLHHQGF